VALSGNKLKLRGENSMKVLHTNARSHMIDFPILGERIRTKFPILLPRNYDAGTKGLILLLCTVGSEAFAANG